MMKIAVNCGVNHRDGSCDVESLVAVSQNEVHVAVLNVFRGPSFESTSDHLAGPDESKGVKSLCCVQQQLTKVPAAQAIALAAILAYFSTVR
jgi:hypothetical protein